MTAKAGARQTLAGATSPAMARWRDVVPAPMAADAVIDDGPRLVGSISQPDVMRALARHG